MLSGTAMVHVWVRSGPTDLRLGFRGLSLLVQREFHRDPRSGDLFLFLNARRSSARVLLWDGTGECIYAKRLPRGQFSRLWGREPGAPLRLSVSELNLFLQSPQEGGGRGRRSS